MIQRLNPYEGYRRSAMLIHVFGQEITNELTNKANRFCQGDIETLVKTNSSSLSKTIPIYEVKLYLSLESVNHFEERIPEHAKQLALLKANELYTLYLERMNNKTDNLSY